MLCVPVPFFVPIARKMLRFFAIAELCKYFNHKQPLIQNHTRLEFFKNLYKAQKTNWNQQDTYIIIHYRYPHCR